MRRNVLAAVLSALAAMSGLAPAAAAPSAQASPIVTVADRAVIEGNSGSTQLQFTLSVAPMAGVRKVTVTTVNQTATAPSDYLAIPPTVVTFNAIGRAFVTVTIKGDTVPEANETFRLRLSNPIGVTLTDTEAIGTITNDDAMVTVPTVSIADLTVTEGNSGTKFAVFTALLSSPAAAPASVRFVTQNSSATAGSDYVATSGTLQFSSGQSAKSISVAINGDTTVEVDEFFDVLIVESSGVTVSDNRARGTIANDDGGGGSGLHITSISNPSVLEGDSGTKVINFAVALSGPATGAERFVISTGNGTAGGAPAGSGGDFVTRLNATITIPAGSTQRLVSVTVNGDTAVESNETFTLHIVSATLLVVDDDIAVGTIRNDD